MKLSRKGLAIIVIGCVLLAYTSIKGCKSLIDDVDYKPFLKTEQWACLSSQERINVLVYIQEQQLEKLNINYDITLQTSNLKSPVVGCYINNKKTILIDEDYLMKKSAKDVVSVLCHEVYHAYQYSLIDYYYTLDQSLQKIPLFDVIEKYEYEFKNYITEGAGYKNQSVEIDANDYASKAILEYQF